MFLQLSPYSYYLQSGSTDLVETTLPFFFFGFFFPLVVALGTNMAFVTSTALPSLGASSATATRDVCARNVPCMAASGHSRRSVLRLAALAGISVASSALAAKNPRKDDDFDLNELQKDVEGLKYDEELVDVGPDPQEKNPTRIKKQKPDPEYVNEERDVLLKSDKKYDDMVAKEESDNERLKQEFSKKK